MFERSTFQQKRVHWWNVQTRHAISQSRNHIIDCLFHAIIAMWAVDLTRYCVRCCRTKTTQKKLLVYLSISRFIRFYNVSKINILSKLSNHVVYWASENKKIKKNLCYSNQRHAHHASIVRPGLDLVNQL